MAEAIKELHISMHSMTLLDLGRRLKIAKHSQNIHKQLIQMIQTLKQHKIPFTGAKNHHLRECLTKFTMIRALWSLIPLIQHGHDSCYKHRKGSIWIWNFIQLINNEIPIDLREMCFIFSLNTYTLEHSSSTDDQHLGSRLIA